MNTFWLGGSIIVAISICLNLILLCQFQSASASNIIVVAFVSTKSHRLTYAPLLQELASRGHNITIVSPVNLLSKSITPNIIEIVTTDSDDYINQGLPSPFELKEKNELPNVFQIYQNTADLCRNTYRLPAVQALLTQKWDLIFLPVILCECSAGFIHKLNASLVLFSTVSAPPMISGLLGSPSPPSFVPNVMTPFSDDMRFYERTMNFLVEQAITNLYHYLWKPNMEALYREELNDSSLPSSDEALKQSSLMLSNSHFSLGGRRPLLPDVIEVGGMQCEEAKPLLQNIEDFISSNSDSGHEHGFILFSMGSIVKASTMPEKYRQILVNTFAKLKQKVIWKWETENMTDLSYNVKLSQWLLQQDVLGHPKIKAFITHGGLGSLTESLYHGVPMVMLPMFGDQPLNANKAVSLGIGLSLEFTQMTEEDLLQAINRVVYEPSYKENIQRLSKIYRDQPQSPLNKAVYWIEYVLRHNGAQHLKSTARDLNSFQYHSIDVIATLTSLTIIILYLTFVLLRCTCRKIWSICYSLKKIKENRS